MGAWAALRPRRNNASAHCGAAPGGAMSGWIECVPNFSEGRDPTVLRELESAIRGVAGVHLLDVHTDEWHHRSVYTFVGEPATVAEAAFRGVRVAVARIDLTGHTGEHPRIGAADVVPFVPLPGATSDDCVSIALGLAKRVGRELDVPVYLYGGATSGPERRELPVIRHEGLKALGGDARSPPRMPPDFGPRTFHPTAGATSIGVRPLLVAFNVFLDSTDARVADEIARQIRTLGGGLPALRAKAFLVAGQAQVSMNLTDVDVTNPQAAFDAVSHLAEQRGLQVAKSEFVGLVPQRAVGSSTTDSLKLSSPLNDRLLEPKLHEVRNEAEARGSQSAPPITDIR